MKKITAIFFVLLFAFNWFGYRLVFDYMQHQANEQLEAVLDNNSYDESELIELKVPVHLPYQSNWTSYQRYNGEIEMNGVTYQYVKRKLANDTLYLKCIPNMEKMHIETARNEFFRISNSLLQNNNSKKQDNTKSVTKTPQTVYYESSLFIKINSPFQLQQKKWLTTTACHLPAAYILSPYQPPEIEVA